MDKATRVTGRITLEYLFSSSPLNRHYIQPRNEERIMSLAICNTRSTLGLSAHPVSVEVHLSNGLPAFSIVGLAETAIKESKERVRSAIINSQYDFPCRRITVNLAPADFPKIGSGFDLPIALGILAASGQISAQHFNNHEFIAELALNGNLRGISPIIPAVLASKNNDRHLIIADTNAEEASFVAHPGVLSAENLREVCAYLSNNTPLRPLPETPTQVEQTSTIDWSDIRGQHHAKHAMEVAAYGGHNLLLYGPPGSGKTMLAKRFNTLLPILTEEKALETASIHSLRGFVPNFKQYRHPPFRAPHHTASPVALVGGGNPPKPGEISLAHNGVLFLDELPEFQRSVLETLREPLESGSICISRASAQMEFPAHFQLIAAMNPCPCGQWGNQKADCNCSPERIQRYLSKLSAPLLERLDMHIQVHPLQEHELLAPQEKYPITSTMIRDKVMHIRTLQFKRQGCLNAHLNASGMEQICVLGTLEQTFIHHALRQLKLSARAFHRLLKISRTLADIRESKHIEVLDIQQALSFRNMLTRSVH